MTKKPEHPFTQVLRAGSEVVLKVIEQAAAGGPDAILAEVENPTSAQARVALIVMVLADRSLQRGPLRFDVDVPALDRLTAAADEGLEPLRDAVVELDEADARNALGQLICLHANLTAASLQAATSARLN